MQGEKVGESTGRVSSRRVLPNPDGGPKMETSFEAGGELLGVGETETGTYWSVFRPDGTIFGEGQGIVSSPEGDLATWVGQGVGALKEGGGVSYRGAIYYQSSSPRWSRLNSLAVVFEYEVDAEGNTRSQLWEWK